MAHNPTIQRVSPPVVATALIQEAYGTYVVRFATKNDEIISSIRFSALSSLQSPHSDFVVLSIRVDETIYKCLVMNYYLTIPKENNSDQKSHLLDQYRSQRKILKRYTQLTHELIIRSEELTWAVDSHEFRHVNLQKGHFHGKNNVGVSKDKWVRQGREPINVFIKAFPKNCAYFKNELTLLRKLCFFPIISLYGHYSDKANDYLVFADGGVSLESKAPLRAPNDRSLNQKIAQIGFQISNAMLYLEKNNIVHRDLTAGNVLVDRHGFVRIADFGHAIQRVEGANNLSSPVTAGGEERFQVRFLPPECLSKPLSAMISKSNDQNRREFYATFTSKSDVWSFGILLIQLMLTKPAKPYPEIEDDKEIVRQVVNEHLIHPKPPQCNIDLYLLLQRCWSYDVLTRVSFTELRQKMYQLSNCFGS